MKKQKILFVHDHLFLGGAAKAALRMRKTCQELGYQTFSIHGDRASIAPWPSLSIHGKPSFFGKIRGLYLCDGNKAQNRERRALNAFQRHLKQKQYDLIWFQNIAGAIKWGWSTSWVNEAARHARTIITMHDMFYLGFEKSYAWDEPVRRTFFAGLGDKELDELFKTKRLFVNAPSDWLRGVAQELYGIKAGKLLVPMADDQFATEAKTKPSGEPTTYLVGSDNLEDERKNILPLLRLARETGILERTNSKIICLGRNLPEDLCSGRIVPLGHVENPSDYRKLFQQVHFLLHPSLIDNFPLIIQDSLALGCPVVALDRGGVAESVRNGITGRLLSEMTRETLKMVFTANAQMTPDSYNQLSQSCLSFAQSNYSEESLKPVYANYLLGVCPN